MLLPFVFFDGFRYTGSMLVMCLFDLCCDGWRWLTNTEPSGPDWSYCPSVAVMIVGLNEADTIESALESVYGTYPRMELFVVSDGSTDGMEQRAANFATKNPGVTVLHRKDRGGKSSAMNMPLPLIKSEIVIVIDSDSHLSAGVIWRIVQPFKDPEVGAVSGTVSARNPFVNLCTWLQALEYRRSIFLGRIFLSRLGILGIVSGALGAFRKSALDKVGGWDVGPGEDGDLTIKLRKSGYKIGFEPQAECLTNVPTDFNRLIKQRRRWEWAAITFECRKHVDVGNPFNRNFRLADFAMMLERWCFNIVLIYVGILYWVYVVAVYPWQTIVNILILLYAIYVVCDFAQLAILFYYSRVKWQDLIIGLASPLMPIYYAMQKCVTAWAITEEILTRRSFRDNFVPQRVREKTWHW